MKAAIFLGNSLKVIQGFPDTAKQRIGNEIHRLQRGKNPADMKPLSEVGAGVYEIRIRSDLSWFRVFYIAKFENEVYVLHAFEKKRNTTALRDINIGKKAYKELVRQKRGKARNV